MMWVKSQDDKRLTECGFFEIAYHSTNAGAGIRTRHSGYVIKTHNNLYLAMYSTEEKAIEVLNEILKAINDKKPSFVMPQDEEVK